MRADDGVEIGGPGFLIELNGAGKGVGVHEADGGELPLECGMDDVVEGERGVEDGVGGMGEEWGVESHKG